ncbi:kinase-like domain-containing protein, partial [Collybia nuda]
RLVVKLSNLSGVVPVSLIIHGIILRDKEAVFGGGFADIYKASYKGQEVAMKRMRVFQRGPEQHKMHQAFCKEAILWKSFNHPNVLPFLGVDSSVFPPNLCMVSPWMHCGTILRHLSENWGVNIDKLIDEIAQGLGYLHSQKVVHGDLRGNNILINDRWEACLADFGLSIISDATLSKESSNRHGSVRWMAPELLQPEAFELDRFVRTTASDIYAFGCVCLEVYTGKPPFVDVVHEPAVMFGVLEGKRPVQPSSDAGRPISNNVWSLIEQCWSQEPSARPSTRRVIEIMEEWK